MDKQTFINEINAITTPDISLYPPFKECVKEAWFAEDIYMWYVQWYNGKKYTITLIISYPGYGCEEYPPIYEKCVSFGWDDGSMTPPEIDIIPDPVADLAIQRFATPEYGDQECETDYIGLARDIALLGANFVAVDIVGKEVCTAVIGAYGGYWTYEHRNEPDFVDYDPILITAVGTGVIGGIQYIIGSVAEKVNPIIKEKIGV